MPESRFLECYSLLGMYFTSSLSILVFTKSSVYEIQIPSIISV